MIRARAAAHKRGASAKRKRVILKRDFVAALNDLLTRGTTRKRRRRVHGFLKREGVCIQCGQPTAAHFNSRNVLVSCNPQRKR